MQPVKRPGSVSELEIVTSRRRKFNEDGSVDDVTGLSTSSSTYTPRGLKSEEDGIEKPERKENKNRKEEPMGRNRPTLDLTPLYTRPSSANSKKGTSGKPEIFLANFFKLDTPTSQSWCKHHVDFDPFDDRTGIKIGLLRSHKDRLDPYLFDGSTLFAPKNVCPDGEPLVLETTKRDGEPVRMTIKFVGTCESGDFQNLQISSIAVRSCLKGMSMQLIGRNHFDPRAKVEVQEHGLELWPGYVTSVIQCENQIFLHAEIKYKVLRTQTAYDLFRVCLSQGGEFMKSYANLITGTRVITKYNNKPYRIDEVDFSTTVDKSFLVKKKGEKEAKPISYLDYYQNRYGVRIHDQRQPMLVSRSSARNRRAGMAELIYLVPELCVMTGLTDEMKNNFHLMKSMHQHTSVGPADRVKRLNTFNKRINDVPEVLEKLSRWSLGLDRELVKISGRVLDSEKIVLGQQVFVEAENADWTRSMRSKQLLTTCELDRWVVICDRKFQQSVDGAIKTIQNDGRPMGFIVGPPRTYAMEDDRANTYVQYLSKAINEVNPRLVFCVVSNNRQDRYMAIKRKCILDTPVPSQVVLAKTINSKNVRSILTKISIQMNCKLGGAPWTVPLPLKFLMAVGFDVCPDPKDKRRCYGAMVATLNQQGTQYFSSVCHQNVGEEVSTNFVKCLMNALRRYLQLNRQLPTHIIIYRDGVSEGELARVHKTEVKIVKEHLDKPYTIHNMPIRLSFIVVTKRHNTKLFLNSRQGQIANPPPGTVIDDVITQPYRYDFYLVSQSVRNGTVSPSHYNVIEDSTGLSPDQLQRLTYKFTHLYYNWMGTVRVPAPCQYAQKLAFLTSQNLGTGHGNLNDRLYFL